MRSVNKVIIIGNITRDPSLRQTPSGQLVTTFGVATNRQWMTQSSDKHSSTEFHEIVAWSKLAELADKHLQKGKLVYIEGYLSTRSWETLQGTKKFKTEIVAQDIIILSRKDQIDHGSTPIPAEAPAETEIKQTATTEAPTQVEQEVVATEPVAVPAVPVAEEEPVLASAPFTEQPNSENLIDKDLGI